MNTETTKVALALLLTKQAAPPAYADQSLTERAAEIGRIYAENLTNRSKDYADYVVRRMARTDPEAFHRFYFSQGTDARARFLEEQAKVIQERQGTGAATAFLERMGTSDPKARALLGRPAAPDAPAAGPKVINWPSGMADPSGPHRYVRPNRRPSRMEAERTAQLLDVVRQNPGSARHVIALARQADMPWLEKQVRSMTNMHEGPAGPGSLRETLADRLGLADVPWRRDAAAQMDQVKWNAASRIATLVSAGQMTAEEAARFGENNNIPWLIRQYGGNAPRRGLGKVPQKVRGAYDAIPWWLGGGDYQHQANKRLGNMMLAQGNPEGYRLAHPVRSRILRDPRWDPFLGPQIEGRRLQHQINRLNHPQQQSAPPGHTDLPLEFFAGMGTGMPQNLPARGPDGGFEPLPTYQGGGPPAPPTGPAPVFPRYSL